MFHFFPFQQPDRYIFDLENLTNLLPAIPKIHALHKTGHIADDAQYAIAIAVAHGDRINTLRAIAKVYTIHKAGTSLMMLMMPSPFQSWSKTLFSATN